MGRFASTVPFYMPYREPYSPAFFTAVADRLGLNGGQRLIDLGCGPAPLAIGFAPFLSSVTGVDPEPEMARAARESAAQAGVRIELIRARVEELPESLGTFDVVTIGRALHWMDRTVALGVLERLVAEGGSILICGAIHSHSPVNRWSEPYEQARRSWADDPNESCYKLELDKWFAGSRFRVADQITVAHRHTVAISGLIGRALSKSNTSPEVLGPRRAEFEASLVRVLVPFAQGGVLIEEIEASATVVR